MARIIVFGGHGKVAMLTHPLLVDAGHQVTAVVRNPDHVDEVGATGATPLVADVEQLDVSAIGELVRAHDAVVFAAGAGGGDPDRTYAVDRDAAIRTIDAAVGEGVPRYVMVSYLGAGPDHGVPEGDPFYAYAEAKAAADTHLRDSDLVWTVLGPSALTTEEPTGRIQVGAERGEVSRGNVAQVLGAVLADEGVAARRTVEFVDGDTPIEQALADASPE